MFEHDSGGKGRSGLDEDRFRFSSGKTWLNNNKSTLYDGTRIVSEEDNDDDDGDSDDG